MNQQTVTKNNTRVELYDWIRVIATIFAVIGHSVYLKITVTHGGIDYQLPLNLSPTYYGKVLSFVREGRWILVYLHMPLFFFLSGAVLGLKPIKSLFYFIKSKIKRLIVPFFAAGFFFMLPIKFPGNFYTFNGMIQAILSYW